MSLRTSLEDVARAAGVSTATVSRVLSRPHMVRADTRDLVMAAISALDYQPDASARALASGRTHTVGCIIPTLDHAIFARSTHALQTTLGRAGYQLLLASHEYSPETEFKTLRVMQQRGVDALVLVGSDHSAALWKAALEWDRPVLLTWSCDKRLPSVGFDNRGAGETMTQHLLELGHRRFGVISGLTANNDRARARNDGVRQALKRAGLRLPAHAVSEQPFTLAGGETGLRTLLAGPDPPTAIVCGNDLLAVGALFEAQRLGIDVPKALSITGIDDQELAQACNPGLTTLRLPTHDLGRIAAESVLSAMAGQAIASQSLLPFELVVRGSSAQAPA